MYFFFFFCKVWLQLDPVSVKTKEIHNNLSNKKIFQWGCMKNISGRRGKLAAKQWPGRHMWTRGDSGWGHWRRKEPGGWAHCEVDSILAGRLLGC